MQRRNFLFGSLLAPFFPKLAAQLMPARHAKVEVVMGRLKTVYSPCSFDAASQHVGQKIGDTLYVRKPIRWRASPHFHCSIPTCTQDFKPVDAWTS